MEDAASADEIVGRWLLDRREPDGVSVYLPYTAFSGRPSRAPRPGLELRADGTFAWLTGGAADGHERGESGHWRRAGPGTFELQPDRGTPVRVTLAGGEPATLRIAT